MKKHIVSVIAVCILAMITGKTEILFSKEKSIQASMAINASLAQTRSMNPDVPKLAKLNSDGLKTLTGPIDIRLDYAGGQSLQFNRAKLVIFQTENSKIGYIHIFPQLENMTDADMKEYVAGFERQLSKSNWQKDTRKKSTINNILQNEGIKDYAYYMYHSEKPLNGVSEYELVLTAFVDANVRCGSGSATPAKACKNRFVRIGVNKL